MYTMAQEDFSATLSEITPLYRQHYAEMKSRKEAMGLVVSPYNPRIDIYLAAAERGDLLTFILRADGTPVGYINVYVTNDMHNMDRFAQEDTVFVLKAHRNGIGRKFIQYGLGELKKKGAMHLIVSAMTDLRVEKLWSRMGFKPLATQMIYVF